MGLTSGLGTDIGFSPNAARAQRDLAMEPVTGLTGNYQLALRDLFFVNTTPFTCAVTLKNLVAGRTYLIQIWGSDGYGSGTDRQVNYTLNDGTDSNSFQIDLNDTNANKGKGQVASFKAVAESTTMVLTMNAAVGIFAGFSAIQVRDISPMYWTVASGNWDATGTNWDPAENTETVWNAATGSVVNAYFTNNATAIITANVWARDINVISNTTIKRAVSAGTTTLTVMRNITIDADRTLTVGSGLGTGNTAQQTAVVVANALMGGGSVDVKAQSRIVLGANAIGSLKATIAGDGGNLNYKGAIQANDNAQAEWSGQITTTSAARLGAGTNGVLTVSGRVTGSTLTIRSGYSTGAYPSVGVVVLSNPTNNYSGNTWIYSPLRLGCNNAVPVSSGFTFSANVNNPSLDLNGYNQEIQNFTGTTAGSNITNSNVAASVLIVSNTVDQAATLLKVAGNLSVIKRGSAKLTFGATNTYSGTTTIEAGTNALSAAGEIASTAKLILAGGTFDVSAKTGYLLAKPLQITAKSYVVGSLAMGATSEVLFDGTVAALAGGTIAMAGQTLKLTTTATLAAGNDYPLISGYTGDTGALPMLDSTGLTVPDGATASLVLAGGMLSLSVVTATTDTTTTVAAVPAETGTYGDDILLAATITPAVVPEGTTVNLYAASDLDTVIDSGIVTNGVVQFTVVKPAAAAYSYVAKYMGGGVYRPSQSAASSSVTIQPKTLTVSDIQLNKLFDGMTNVAPSFVTTGVIAGEPNPVTCAGYYEDAAPGTSKPVALVWNQPNLNYALTGNSSTGQGAIFEHAVWTGGAADGLWHTSGNWDQGIVPNNSGVAVLFNTDATVALASGVSIKKLTFNAHVTLNGPETFAFSPQYPTGEVVVASSKTATLNALVSLADEGILKKGSGTMILMGNHGFGGKLDVREGVVEINQTTAGPLTARDYTIAENATLRFVCDALGSAGTQLTGTKAVTGDGIFEVASGFLRIQSSTAKVSMSMSDKGQIIVRNGAKMDNSSSGNDRFYNNRAKLFVEGTGLFDLADDTIKVGSLHGDGQVKSGSVSHTLSIMGDTDGLFSGILTEKDANTKLMLAKWGLGTQILSGTNSYTGVTSVFGGRLTLAGGTNRLSVNTPVTVTNAVLDLGLTQQTFNINPIFRAGSKLAVNVSKTEIGRLTLTNSVDVSSWKMTINNPSAYPVGKKYAVVSTGIDKIITGVPTLLDLPPGFIIFNKNNTIFIDFPGTIISFY
jgi:autotransporter-associated beta strand protein